MRKFWETLQNFAEILQSVAICDHVFCLDSEKLVVDLRSGKKQSKNQKFSRSQKGEKFHCTKSYNFLNSPKDADPFDDN